MGLREFFRHGLGMEPEPPDPDLEAFMTAMADELVRRRLAAVAAMMLASGLPLSFLASQLLIFAEPLVQTLTPLRNYKRFIALLEDRARVERFIEILEERERAHRDQDKADQ